MYIKTLKEKGKIEETKFRNIKLKCKKIKYSEDFTEEEKLEKLIELHQNIKNKTK